MNILSAAARRAGRARPSRSIRLTPHTSIERCRNPADAWLAGFLAIDSPASSTLTRELFGWQPTQPELIDDLDKGHHFDNRNGQHL